jgi:hypothetical protein
MKIEIVPSVDVQKYLEFDCRDKKDRVISQLKLRNHGDTNLVELELMIGFQANDHVDGLIHGQAWNWYNQSTVRNHNHNSSGIWCNSFNLDPSKVKEIEKQKFSLSLLELEFPVEPSELNTYIKQKKSLAITHVFDVPYSSPGESFAAGRASIFAISRISEKHRHAPTNDSCGGRQPNTL